LPRSGDFFKGGAISPYYSINKGKEDKMERALFEEFKEGRKPRKAIRA
jgi:hypothetical protein